MDNFESVNNVEIAEPQQTEQVETSTESVNEEVTTSQQTEKPVQSAEENAKFASIRREYEAKMATESQKAIDAEYDRLYGSEYNIHSKADYDRVVAEQQAEEQRQQYQEQYGIDPNIIDERVKMQLENHPAVQAAKAQERTLTLNNAAMELSKVAKTLGINEEIKTWEDVEKLPKWESIKQGVVNNNLDIVTAAKLAYFDEVVNSTSTKAQQETISKLTANSQSSPGSLVNATQDETFFTKEQVEKMSKEDVLKNYDKITKSTKKW